MAHAQRVPFFFLALLLLAGDAAAKKRRGTNAQATAGANRKRECEVDCEHIHEDDRGNCVLKCQSEACYAEVYLPEELEPGEIDLKRQREFNSCMSKEARQQSAERMKSRREQQIAANKPAEQQEQQEQLAAGQNVEL